MSSTTFAEFNHATEAVEVAQAFASRVQGKTVLITGVNKSGIGFGTAEGFASQSPSHLIVAGRTLSKLQESIDALRIKYPDVDYQMLVVDLSSQKSVRSAAANLLDRSDIPKLDIIVNNAAVMCLQERTLSEDGIEMHFAANHLGHWLFTSLVMPKLIAAAEGQPKGSVRVVNVSSLSPLVACIRWSDVNFDKINKDLPESEQPGYDFLEPWGYKDPQNMSYVPLEGYNQSKAANLLNTIAQNKRLFDKYGVLAMAVHPGLIHTELGRSFGESENALIASQPDSGIVHKTQGAGASTTLVAALDPKLSVGETRNGVENVGIYLDDCQISTKAGPRASSSSEAEKLWTLSETLVNQTFAW